MSVKAVTLFICVAACLVLNAHGQRSADPCLDNLSDEGINFGFAAPRYDGLALRNWRVKSVEKMRACLKSFPFNAADATTTIDAIQQYLHLYPFLDSNRNTGAPYNLSVSTDSDFEQLRQMVKSGSSFDSSFDFHVAVKNIIQQARDGHFHYAPPKGFGAYFVLQPISLYAKQSESDPEHLHFFMKADASLGLHDSFFGGQQPLGDFIDREVVSVNGIPTYDYITSLARQYPMGKDDGVNFNYWMFHALVFRGTNLPKENSMQVEFAPLNSSASKSTVLAVNYLVFDANQAAVTRRAFNRAQLPSCKSQKRSDDMAATVEDDELKTISQIQREHFFDHHDEWHSNSPLHDHLKQRKFIEDLLVEHTGTTLKRTGLMGSAASASDFKVISSDDAAGYAVIVYKNDNLVIQLRSFLPGSRGEGFWGTPINWVMAHAHEYERIIIDISDNVGGLVCLGQALTGLFTGTRVTDVHDIRRTALFDKYVPQMPVRNMRGGINYLKSFYFTADRDIVRGGEEGSYTPPFTMYCDDVTNALRDATPRQPISKDKVMLVSNGVSISTASVFAKGMAGLGMKAMTFGGLPGRPMSTSFSIGNPVVVDTSSLYSIFACSGASQQFPKFPDSAQLGFPFAEAYEFEDALVKDLPMEQWRVAEFVMNEANHHLNLWDDSAPSKIYDAAIAFMTKADPKSDA